jgi:hypothetical protein
MTCPGHALHQSLQVVAVQNATVQVGLFWLKQEKLAYKKVNKAAGTAGQTQLVADLFGIR